jgi:hypothetical protein
VFLIFFKFQVPEKYICGTCKNPRLGRRSQLHNLDHDWMKEGLLPTPSSSSAPQPSAELQLLSRLMSELSALSSLLHSLQVKLSVAEQATHPKVFMWSAPWEEGAEEEVEGEEWSSLASHEPPPPFPGRHNDHEDFTHMEMGGSNSDPAPVSCDSGGESSGQSDATRRCGTEGDQTKSEDCSVLLSSAENPPVSQSHESGSSSVDPFSFFDFPSLNEVKQLLPSVLKDISSMEELGGAAVATAAAPLSRVPPPMAVNIIPEPKLINREESRLNLIGHIEHLQELLDGRLDLVEQRLNELELPQQQQQQSQQQQQQPQQQQTQQQQQQPQQQQQQQQPGVDCANIAQAVSRLLTDIQSMKAVNAMLSDRI